MARKFKHLRRPMILAAAAIWIGYIFLAKGIVNGFMTIVLLLVMLMAVNVGL
ncbi:MAG: hypothetical protein BMS9Abin26_1534 [Gammaproteobacteria bacterium]|nr:MAG: hypothetical protein BMS9Abin26_1534 [Gammaproteobacteria bacterium]